MEKRAVVSVTAQNRVMQKTHTWKNRSTVEPTVETIVESILGPTVGSRVEPAVEPTAQVAVEINVDTIAEPSFADNCS